MATDLPTYLQELKHNGYCVLRGAKLKEFKELFSHLIYSEVYLGFDRDMDVPIRKELADKQKLSKIKKYLLPCFSKQISQRDINVTL